MPTDNPLFSSWKGQVSYRSRAWAAHGKPISLTEKVFIVDLKELVVGGCFYQPGEGGRSGVGYTGTTKEGLHRSIDGFRVNVGVIGDYVTCYQLTILGKISCGVAFVEGTTLLSSRADEVREPRQELDSSYVFNL